MSNLDLDLGIIGNCSFSALVDNRGAHRLVLLLPRFDGDPVFYSLLANSDDEEAARGVYEVTIDDLAHSEQECLTNTAILVTRLYDSHGSAIEITDFAPRFEQFGRMFRPMIIVRVARPLSGTPRVRI